MARTKASASRQIKEILSVADGGTNVATLPINELVVGNGTGSVLALAPGTDGNVAKSNGTSWASSRLKASEVDIDKLGSPTYDTAQKYINTSGSPGRITGGQLSVNGGDATKYDIAGLQGTIRIADDSVSSLLPFGLSGATARSTTTNSTIYVGVGYNSGTPQFVERSTNNFDLNTEWLLGVVVNQAGTLYIYSNPWDTSGATTGIIQRFDSIGMQRSNRVGGLLLGETGTRNVTVTAGLVLDLINEHPISALDTSITGNFETYYYNGSAWVQGTATQWPNTQYNDVSSGLVTLSAGRYMNLWFYVVGYDRVVMLYGQLQSGSIATITNTPPPLSLPPELTEFGLLIGRMIIQKNASSATEIDSAFEVVFNSTQATVHNNLSGLQGGTLNEYYHATSAEHAVLQNTSGINTGDQNLSGYELLSNKATDFSTVNNTLYPSVQAVSTAINDAIIGLLNYRGTYDASSNLFPSSGGSGLLGAIRKGDFWVVSVSGTLGGTAVTNGDLVIALQSLPGQTSSNWDLVAHDGTYITALTGDVTATGPGSVSATLASIISASTVGSSTQIPIITYDAKGRITSTTTATISSGAATPTSMQANLIVADHTQMLYRQQIIIGSRSIIMGTDASLIGV